MHFLTNTSRSSNCVKYYRVRASSGRRSLVGPKLVDRNAGPGRCESRSNGCVIEENEGNGHHCKTQYGTIHGGGNKVNSRTGHIHANNISLSIGEKGVQCSGR